jgi:sulfur dioxygenase
VDFEMHGVEDYAALVASLRLPDPKMRDAVVPANMRQGLHQEEVARLGLFDIRSEGSCREEGCANRSAREGRARSAGTIPGSVHAPCADL